MQCQVHVQLDCGVLRELGSHVSCERCSCYDAPPSFVQPIAAPLMISRRLNQMSGWAFCMLLGSCIATTPYAVLASSSLLLRYNATLQQTRQH